MDFMEVVKTRRSVRHFKPDPIPDEVLEGILDAIRWAPTGCNRPSWEVIVVRDPEKRERMARCGLRQSFLAEAPVVVVFCCRERLRGKDYEVSTSWRSEIGGVIQTMLLAAHAFGLGACWMTMDEGSVKELLGIPEELRVAATIPLGYPDEVPTNPMKRSVQELVHYDSWGRMRLDDVLARIREDTEKAIGDFEARRLEIMKTFKDPNSRQMLRLEEKYSAWVFPNLVRRWISSAERLGRPPTALIDRSLGVLDDYERERSRRLKDTGDIDSPEVIEHERRYAPIFIDLLREWLKFK